jgi:hypothetical protein
MSVSQPAEFDAAAWLSALFDGDGVGPTTSDTTNEGIVLDGAAADLIAPEPTEDPEPLEADLLDHVTEWNANGWPKNTVPPPPPCGRCGSLDAWLPLIGDSTTTYPEPWKPTVPRWRCQRCDGPARWNPARRRATEKTAALAARSREITPMLDGLFETPCEASNERIGDE